MQDDEEFICDCGAVVPHSDISYYNHDEWNGAVNESLVKITATCNVCGEVHKAITWGFAENLEEAIHYLNLELRE
jgi:hypothetical protein